MLFSCWHVLTFLCFQNNNKKMEILARWFSQDFRSFLSSVTDPPFRHFRETFKRKWNYAWATDRICWISRITVNILKLRQFGIIIDVSAVFLQILNLSDTWSLSKLQSSELELLHRLSKYLRIVITYSTFGIKKVHQRVAWRKVWRLVF